MNRTILLCLYCLVLFVVLCATKGTVSAQTKRALIVGINRYQIHSSGDRVPDLDGAVADAEAMAAMLQEFHGFAPQNIRILRDQDATRAAILSLLETHLEQLAQLLDVSLFYYAGHGSYASNALSREADGRDETIVPADANLGVPDIRDKELARHFHRILDRKAHLVAILDSCHSGSIARGLPDLAKNRFAPPPTETNHIKRATLVDISTRKKPVEERGGLIWSAAQEHQPAQEKRFRGRPRGRFSSAVEQILSGPYREESVDRLHLRVRAIMQNSGSAQEPVLGADKDRQKQALWGMRATNGSRGDRSTVAVSRVSKSRVNVQAGIAMGIGEHAILRKQGDPNGVRLRILEVNGMASSTAEVLTDETGSGAPQIASGDLFEIESYGKPHGEGLHLYVPTNLPTRAEQSALLKAWAPLFSDPHFHFVRDPTDQTPTHVIDWEMGRWRLRSSGSQQFNLGAEPNVKLVRKLLRGAPRASIFVNLPLCQELAGKLREYLQTNQTFIRLVEDPAAASYHLVGRALPTGQTPQTYGIEHALVLPSTQASDSHSALPSRSNWFAADDKPFLTSFLTEAKRLNKILLWRSIDSPVPDGTFPYELAILDINIGKTVPPGTPLRAGGRYQLTMIADQLGPNLRPRYVYIFSLDRGGNCVLHLPLSDSSNVENLIPDIRPGSGSPPALIPIGNGFSVSHPLGRELMIAISTVTPIASPSAFCSDNTQRAVLPVGSDPLSRFLFGLNADTRSTKSVPSSWAVQRLVLDSVDN